MLRFLEQAISQKLSWNGLNFIVFDPQNKKQINDLNAYENLYELCVNTVLSININLVHVDKYQEGKNYR